MSDSIPKFLARASVLRPVSSMHGVRFIATCRVSGPLVLCTWHPATKETNEGTQALSKNMSAYVMKWKQAHLSTLATAV
eukprot:1152791-Pelagomonas_calceolata.AAC.6